MALETVSCYLCYALLGIDRDITLPGDLVITDIQALTDDPDSLLVAVCMDVLVLADLLSAVLVDCQYGLSSSFQGSFSVFTISIWLLWSTIGAGVGFSSLFFLGDIF